MTRTTFLRLTKDDPSELYSVQRVNANSDTVDRFAESVSAQLGGITMRKLTEAEYAAITEPDENTLYLVTPEAGVTCRAYLGSLMIAGGGGRSDYAQGATKLFLPGVAVNRTGETTVQEEA